MHFKKWVQIHIWVQDANYKSPTWELDPKVHQARTCKSQRDSWDKNIKFDWDLLPGCSNWLGFIEDEQSDVMFIILASERSTALKLWPDQNGFTGRFQCFSIPGCRAVLAYELICLTVLITHCPLFSSLKAWALELYREEASERNKRERRNGQLVWSGGTVPQRGRGEGGREQWKRPGAISHPSCQAASKESRGRAFSSEGRMWNADHRLEESTIQIASLPYALYRVGEVSAK